MKLIIAEKPGVARDIAEAINADVKGEGFIKNSEYTITWAFGHLLEIDNSFMPEGNWSYSNLPILPGQFNYVTLPSTTKQFKIIKNLLSTVNSVIIATDAGREGELIARLILNQAGWNNWNNTYRFWTSEALSKSVINKCLNNLQPSSKFDGLYYAALTRQHADWLCGINLTQAVSLQSGSGTWSVGRVQTPTLKLIVDRFIHRNNFKPEKYFVLKATFLFQNIKYEGYFLNNKINPVENIPDENNEEIENEIGGRLNKSYAASVIDYLTDSKFGKIASVIKEDKKENPSLLHSLTSLQREANTSFGLSAQQTLDIAQELYEKHKVLSYPRTDSQYLAESSKDLVITVLNKLNRSVLTPAVEKVGKRVFNDAKLSDHHAIIPLSPAPESLSKDELTVYNLVLRKFLGAFMPMHEYQTTTIITMVKECSFKTTGKIITNPGWKALYGPEDKKELLPNVEEGNEVIKEKIDVEEKMTKPLPFYTEATLLAAMERLNLGTTATMASIIETLLKRQYIGREKKNLSCTEKGYELITKAAGRNFIEPELTATWETKLEIISKSEQSAKGYDNFISDIKTFVAEEIEAIKEMDIKKISPATAKMYALAKELAKTHKVKLESTSFEYIKEFIEKYKEAEIGKCSCGKQIKDGPKAWSCDCGKIVWKEQFNKKLTLKQAIDLLNDKTVNLIGLISPKTKQKFDAKAKLNINKLEFDFSK